MSGWQIQIYEDRYSGTYSGGEWVCFPPLPSEAYNQDGFRSRERDLEDAFGGDVDSLNFWESGRARFVGRGDTPDEALADMHERHSS